MKTYNILYGSQCGSLELDLMEIEAKDPNDALEKFKNKMIKKNQAHSSKTLFFNVFENSLLDGCVKI